MKVKRVPVIGWAPTAAAPVKVEGWTEALVEAVPDVADDDTDIDTDDDTDAAELVACGVLDACDGGVALGVVDEVVADDAGAGGVVVAVVTRDSAGTDDDEAAALALNDLQ